ncbi:MAG TPA: hypothetical protein VFG64_02845 [Dongiaceae bacterium]|nr:hypothetical protein [Dongiaceae bacterium]
MTRPYAVSCHCGAVRLSVGAELTGLEECNCSTCGRSGFLHWQVPAEAVRLLTQKRALTPICGAMPAAGRSSARPAALT